LYICICCVGATIYKKFTKDLYCAELLLQTLEVFTLIIMPTKTQFICSYESTDVLELIHDEKDLIIQFKDLLNIDDLREIILNKYDCKKLISELLIIEKKLK